MIEIAGRIAWWLGFIPSPSRRMVDGHGYSWIGKKVRRKTDIDWHTEAAAGIDD